MTIKYQALLLFFIIERVLLGQSGGLALSSTTANAGGSTSLDLSLSSGASDAGLQWSLNYSPAQVTNIQVAGGAALAGAGKSLNCMAGTGTYTCLAQGLNTNVIQPGVVAVVTVTLASNLAGGTPVGVNVLGSLGTSNLGDAVPMSGTGGVVNVAGTTPALAGISC